MRELCAGQRRYVPATKHLRSSEVGCRGRQDNVYALKQEEEEERTISRPMVGGGYLGWKERSEGRHRGL